MIDATEMWLWCNCDDGVPTVQRAVAATPMWLRQNMSVTQWRHNFVILFTDVDSISYSSSIKYEIDVIKSKIWQQTINCL